MENLPELAQTSNAMVEPEIRYFAGDWSELKSVLPHAHPSKHDFKGGYDVILMAETVYSMATLPSLYTLIKECINYPNGTVYMAGKKHFFGVGGGTRQFISIVEKDRVMDASLIAELADGSSNLREVWKLSCKQN